MPLPASLLTQRVCSSTVSTSDANDPMAIISMLFLFVKQLSFIVARSLKTAQEFLSDVYLEHVKTMTRSV